MTTLLHHIQPWMHISIDEAADRIEKKMSQWTEWQIMEVHQHLDTFELRLLAWPAPTVDLKTLQVVVASLRVDIDAILEVRVPESEAPSAEPSLDTVMATLLSTIVAPSPQPREHTNRHRSIEDDETRSRKRQHIELEDARRASLIDEEAREMSAQEVVCWGV